MLRKYGYIWITLALFLISLTAQWVTHVEDTTSFINAIMENWQSEFLQLIWQVLGLKFLLCWGSPQSREGDERMERKIDNLREDVRALLAQQQ